MTYNQVVKLLRDLLESHAIIKTVKFAEPAEWINRDSVPVFPVSCFAINSGTISTGRQNTFDVTMWFLDKTGTDENIYQTEVISDQVSIAEDIIRILRTSTTYDIDEDVAFQVVEDKFEDYLSGVQLNFKINTQSQFDGCDMPTS